MCRDHKLSKKQKSKKGVSGGGWKGLPKKEGRQYRETSA